ncbi:MAG: hypothetical protein WAO10_22720, partial [Candidatus Sulfotelmatobacter sp.]
AEAEIANDQQAGFIGGEKPVELNRVAGEFGRGPYSQTIRICDFEAQFSSAALAQNRQSAQ